jgi:prepilin-type N-terminal cleavage/methylation domain-containing protein
MRRKLAFTMIETLVVVVIIAILTAILIPVLSAAKARAKLTSCQARLYQYSRAGEIEGGSQGDVSHCPDPQGDDDGAYIDVSSNYTKHDPNYEPDAGTVKAFCIEHIKRGATTPFGVPLSGKFPVLNFGHGTRLVDAKGVTRWQKQGKKWVQIDETGDLPVYPTIWHFPGDDFPP